MHTWMHISQIATCTHTDNTHSTHNGYSCMPLHWGLLVRHIYHKHMQGSGWSFSLFCEKLHVCVSWCVTNDACMHLFCAAQVCGHFCLFLLATYRCARSFVSACVYLHAVERVCNWNWFHTTQVSGFTATWEKRPVNLCALVILSSLFHWFSLLELCFDFAAGMYINNTVLLKKSLTTIT